MRAQRDGTKDCIPIPLAGNDKYYGKTLSRNQGQGEKEIEFVTHRECTRYSGHNVTNKAFDGKSRHSFGKNMTPTMA